MPHLVDGPGVRVASVSRAMRVLEAFAGHPEGVALSRLAAKLGHGKASLSKILGTLAREGFVRQDPLTARFHLGWRLLALAFGHAERVGMPGLCLLILPKLADQTHEPAPPPARGAGPRDPRARRAAAAHAPDAHVAGEARRAAPAGACAGLRDRGRGAGRGRAGGGGADPGRGPGRGRGRRVGADLPRLARAPAPPRPAPAPRRGRARRGVAAARGGARLRPRRAGRGQRPGRAGPDAERPGRLEYHEPPAGAEAVAPGARFGEAGRFLAGGTDLIIQMRRGKVAPRHVLSLHRVPGLDRIEANGAITLGALVTHRAVERCADFQGPLGALVEGARVVGGHQIRNVATVGGNVVNASPAADVVPVLLTLDATVTCLGPDGERTLPLEGFLTGPGH